MIKVASIVEGDGEVSALPILLRRINEWQSPGLYVNALPPIRVRRDRFLNKDDEFRNISCSRPRNAAKRDGYWFCWTPMMIAPPRWERKLSGDRNRSFPTAGCRSCSRTASLRPGLSPPPNPSTNNGDSVSTRQRPSRRRLRAMQRSGCPNAWRAPTGKPSINPHFRLVSTCYRLSMAAALSASFARSGADRWRDKCRKERPE